MELLQIIRKLCIVTTIFKRAYLVKFYIIRLIEGLVSIFSKIVEEYMVQTLVAYLNNILPLNTLASKQISVVDHSELFFT